MNHEPFSKIAAAKRRLDDSLRRKLAFRPARRSLMLESLEGRRMLTGDVLVKVSDDPNANGISDPGEDRLSGWTVYLDANQNGSLDTGEVSLLTDGRGEALFTGLEAGNYRVGEVVRPNYIPTTPAFVNARVRDGRQENVSFLDFHPLIGSIEGTVWNDVDGDGLRATDPTTGAFTEPGIAGRTLFLDTNHDGLLSPGESSTVTDVVGQYSFTALPAGNYTVAEILPAGWEPTDTSAASQAVTVQTDLITTQDFGTFATQPVTIQGTVWNDLNGDGIRDVDPTTHAFTDPGIAGRQVFVDVNGDESLNDGEPSAITDANGLYTITGASHGNFTIREVSLPDWVATAPETGARTLFLRNGQTMSGVDFGSTTAKAVTIQGTVWNDVNGDGVRAVDPITGTFLEPGIGGFQVFADLNGDGALTAGEPSAVSDSSGLYTITGASRGSFTVREVQQADWIPTAPASGARALTLRNGQVQTGVDFGNRPRQESTISGTVYADTNQNGTRDAGERGLAGITVYLDLNNNGSLDAGEPQTVTSADLFFTPAVNEAGFYSFTHLAAGTYHVREIVPVDQSSTPTAQRLHDVTLVTTESHGGVDFGNQFRPNEIHGVNFNDVNKNHLRDAGEPGIGGVTVFIDSNRDNILEPGEPSTITAADGSYSFTNLTPGAYVVRQVHGSGYEASYPGTVGGILWPAGVSNPSSGNVTPGSITTSLADGESHTETVSLTLPNNGGLTNLVDVFLLFDDTGSFTSNSPIVRAAFPEIISTLQTALPGIDFGFGVGRFEEYGNFASEFSTGRPFILNQPIVASSTPGFAPSIQAALDRVAPGYGGDTPETLIEALYQTVTGAGFDGNNNGTVSDSGAAGLASTQTAPGASGDVPAFSSFTADPANSVLPAAGHLGGAGFRPGALPIILAATDTGFAYQPQGETSITGLNGLTLPLSALTQASRATTPFSSGAGIQQTITGLNALGALVVGLGVNGETNLDPRQDLESIAKLTGATNQSASTIPNGTATPIGPGDPLYFQIGTGFGGTVANGVVNAIQNAATNVAVNITLRASDPRVHIINHTGTLSGIGAGQTASFDIEFVGDGRPHRFDLQFVREGTSVVLGSIPVVIGTPIPGDGYEFEDLEEGQIEDASDFGSMAVVPSSVVGQHLFYNQSGTAGAVPRFDGNNPAIDALDDHAIATDKTAYVPGGGLATFANVSSYTKGINGIMVDVSGMPGTLTLSDFVFKVGNNNAPSTWAVAPAPNAISTRTGAGEGGSDRVEITWNNNAIQNTWLEVTVKANANTGLTADQVFFWGSAPADSGTGDGASAVTNTSDENAARSNPASLLNNIAVTNLYDYNRDGKVDPTDQSLARTFANAALTAPRFINIPLAGPLAPLVAPTAVPAAATTADSGIASALVATASSSAPPKVQLPHWISKALGHIDLNHGAVAKLFQQLAASNSPTAKKILVEADRIADAQGLDDELLDNLVAGLLG